MNDDELGRALGTALAAPELVPTPDAGARLRGRAHRARTERLAVGGTSVLVLALLLTIGVIRGTGGGAPTTPTASPATASFGFSRLRTPLTVAAGVVRFTTDEVTSIRVSPLPESGVTVAVTLTATDMRTLTSLLGPGRRGDVLAGAEEVFPADATATGLRIRVPTPRLTDELVASLAPYRPVARTGAGRLDVPLQLWTVTASAAGSCSGDAAPSGTLLVDRIGECLTLRGPGASIGSADLGIRPASGAADPSWVVTVGVSGPEAAVLAAYTGGHVRDRVAFVAGGRLVGAVPEREGALGSGVEIAVTDRDEAVALVSRLRR
jgi:hypothetical protein